MSSLQAPLQWGPNLHLIWTSLSWATGLLWDAICLQKHTYCGSWKWLLPSSLPTFTPPPPPSFPKSWSLLKAQWFPRGHICLSFSSGWLIVHAFHLLRIWFKYESIEPKHPALRRAVTLLYFILPNHSSCLILCSARSCQKRLNDNLWKESNLNHVKVVYF